MSKSQEINEINSIIRHHLKIEKEFPYFHKLLKGLTLRLEMSLNLECPICHELMKKKVSLITQKIFWNCQCFGTLDTLEILNIIKKRSKIRQNSGVDSKKWS